ncbi:serine hydrolase domain-containing protein [Flagellimonas flava]|uniref:CubicO group peptidase, beta-lactamase class C family n=1 Tax=Flagellimonas flava TaxID=570519 RepID=A0A1M5IPQ4_9FLAO|nr:serine hydrolase [Allomuricauda flava]SHG30334.1 CubicO group peptidase, beta-lactamase class C family [Allomuricauda flava]
MLKKLFILALVGLSLQCCAQVEKKDYEGNWVGTISDKHSFNFTVTLTPLEENQYQLTIANETTLIDRNIKSDLDGEILLTLDTDLSVHLFDDAKEGVLAGFIKSGQFFYHVALKLDKQNNQYTGQWNPFMFNDGLFSNAFVLYVENLDDGSMAAYPIFSDTRYRGAYALDFRMQQNILSFRDSNTGFRYKAYFLKDTIKLEFLLMDVLVTDIALSYSEDGIPLGNTNAPKNQSANTPKELNDGWKVANINRWGIDSNKLNELIDSINTGQLVNMHSILISKENSLVFEAYFDAFNAQIPHTLMSGSKSVSSAMIGIAIDGKIVRDVDEKLYGFIPEKYQYTIDSLKSKITIKDLLTMSSGFDVNNLAQEDYYQNPNNPNSWLQTVLEAPMVKTPGMYADYGSANPFLLGVCLNERLNQPLEIYMDEKLFAPLGITNYINFADDTGLLPYFGGGMLLTPRDMLKFGQLYLNGGTWNGQQIISENWIEKSFKKHTRLQDYPDKNEYGYLWWHDSYNINGKIVKSIEARGAGGQFIFVVPELGSVVVMTAGNFRNRKGNQSREIFERFVLPAIIN